MISVRVRGRSRALAPIVLAVTLVLAAFSAGPVTAQSTVVDTLEEAYAFLRAVPALQVNQLRVSADPPGDAGPGADATWGATGVIEFRNKLRNWLKALVESDHGWGRLPARNVPVVITFIGMAQPPSLKGPHTTVVHQGIGDDSFVTQGLQVNPFEGDRVVDSFGIWSRDGVFYPQNGTSPVTAGGITWFGDAVRGAGGIVMPEGIIVNVTPLERGGGQGGGGKVGGSVHHFTESTTPGEGDPNAITRDYLFGNAGSERQRLDGFPAANVAECVSTLGSTLPSGSRQVVVNIETDVDFDAETLEGSFRLDGYAEDGTRLGTYSGAFTSLPLLGLHRGTFVIDDPAVAYVRMAPPAEAAEAILADGGKASDDPAVVAGQIALGNAASGIGVLAAYGDQPCGKSPVTADPCDARIGAAVSGMVDGVPVEAMHVRTPDGQLQCHYSVDGQVRAIASFSGEPGTPENVREVAAVPGCPVSEAGDARDSVMAECESLAAWIWINELALALAYGVEATPEERIGFMTSFLLFPTATVGGVPSVHAADPVMAAMDTVVEGG